MNEHEHMPKKVLVKRVKENPYAPLLKLIYRSFLAVAIFVVIWLGYEVVHKARVGLNEHKKQQQEYRKALGLPAEEQPEKAKEGENKNKPSEQVENDDEEGTNN